MNTLPLKIPFFPAAHVAQNFSYVAAKSICQTLAEQGFIAFFVGGSVRDILLFPNSVPTDFDIATSAPAKLVNSLFPKTHYVGKAFGVNLVNKEGFLFEVTTLRKEGAYSDRRHPDFVEVGTLADDSCRRDFTMNSLYFDPLQNVLVDHHGGLKDLEDKKIACVGNAEHRLHEDPLRIVRLYRFAANFDFHIDSHTLQAAQKEQDGISLLSKERILLEFSKVKAGKFEIFLTRLCADILPKSVFGAQVSDHFLSGIGAPLKKNSIALSSPLFHVDYPGGALVLMALCQQNLTASVFQDLCKGIANWPLSTADKTVVNTAERMVHLFSQSTLDSSFKQSFAVVGTLRMISRQRENLLAPFCEVLTAVSGSKILFSPDLSKFLKAFADHASSFINAGAHSVTIGNWLAELVPQSALVFPISAVEEHAVFNSLNKNLLSFVMSLQEMSVLLNSLGLAELSESFGVPTLGLNELFASAAKVKKGLT